MLKEKRAELARALAARSDGLVSRWWFMQNQLDGTWILNIRRSSFVSRTWSCRRPQAGSRTMPDLSTWMPIPAP